jgi:hypothetical protein
MPRQDTKLESEGAEYLVLGNLLIEGIPAYKAYHNTRGYDLVATWPETNRSARIQVKSRWATDANSHLVKVVDCDFLVLARLNRGYRFSGRLKKESMQSEAPSFYVLSRSQAEARLVTAGWGKIIWRKEEFEDFQGRWDIIRSFLVGAKKEE